MIYDLSSKIDLAEAIERLDFLIKNERIVELKEVRAIRSNQQNRYLHLIFKMIAAETGYDAETVKQDIVKRIVCKEIFLKKVTGKSGKTIESYRSTSELDSKEMTDVIERIRDYFSVNLDMYIPAPNESQKLLYLERRLSQLGNYL